MAGDHVDERGLPRAVGPDDAHGLLRRDVEGDIARRHNRAEGLLQIAHRKDRGHDPFSGVRPRRENSEPSPSGRNRMVSSSAEPRMSCQKPGRRSMAIERTSSNTREPTKAAATEPTPARMVTNTKPPEVVQYAMLGSTCATASAASAPPRPASIPEMTSLRWMRRVTEMPRNSKRISLSRAGIASAPATVRK